MAESTTADVGITSELRLEREQFLAELRAMAEEAERWCSRLNNLHVDIAVNAKDNLTAQVEALLRNLEAKSIDISVNLVPGNMPGGGGGGNNYTQNLSATIDNSINQQLQMLMQNFSANVSQTTNIVNNAAQGGGGGQGGGRSMGGMMMGFAAHRAIETAGMVADDLKRWHQEGLPMNGDPTKIFEHRRRTDEAQFGGSTGALHYWVNKGYGMIDSGLQRGVNLGKGQGLTDPDSDLDPDVQAKQWEEGEKAEERTNRKIEEGHRKMAERRQLQEREDAEKNELAVRSADGTFNAGKVRISQEKAKSMRLADDVEENFSKYGMKMDEGRLNAAAIRQRALGISADENEKAFREEAGFYGGMSSHGAVVGAQIAGDMDKAQRLSLEGKLAAEREQARREGGDVGGEYFDKNVAAPMREHLSATQQLARQFQAAQSRDRIEDMDVEGKSATMRATGNERGASNMAYEHSLDDRIAKLKEAADAEQDLTKKTQLQAEADKAAAEKSVLLAAELAKQAKESAENIMGIRERAYEEGLRSQSRFYEAQEAKASYYYDREIKRLREGGRNEEAIALESDKAAAAQERAADHTRSIQPMLDRAAELRLRNEHKPHLADFMEKTHRIDRDLAAAAGDKEKQHAIRQLAVQEMQDFIQGEIQHPGSVNEYLRNVQRSAGGYGSDASRAMEGARRAKRQYGDDDFKAAHPDISPPITRDPNWHAQNDGAGPLNNALASTSREWSDVAKEWKTIADKINGAPGIIVADLT